MGRNRMTAQGKYEKAYHNWLVSLVDTPMGDLARDYSLLMDDMDNFEFVPVHLWDDNRITAAYAMRNRFHDYVWKKPDNMHVERDFVSVLEVLVCIFTSLSDNVFTEPGDESLAPDMMRVNLSELSLLWCKNSNYDRAFVVKKLEDFVKRDEKITFFQKSSKKVQDLYAAYSLAFGHIYVKM